MTTKANDSQIGGDHYKTPFQCWDLDRLELGHYEISAVQYIVRWRKKDGLQDIKKAIHYTEKLIEEIKYWGRKNRAYNGNGQFTLGMATVQFLDSNAIENDHERKAIDLLINWRTIDQVYSVLDELLILQKGAVTDQKVSVTKADIFFEESK